MSQSAIWGVVVVLVLVGLGLFLWRSTSPNGEGTEPLLETTPAAESPALVSPGGGVTVGPSPVVETSPVAEATISIDETGFSPKTTTVKAGTKVTFANNGQALHWPASAIHPTHQLLPGFDALRGLATGETYSFTFTKTGSWNCHDHLNPQFTCTVVVE